MCPSWSRVWLPESQHTWSRVSCRCWCRGSYPQLGKAPSHWHLFVCQDSVFPRKNSCLLKPWLHCSQMAKPSTDSYESMISPSSLPKLSDCLPHWKFHPKHPTWAAFFKISLTIRNVHCLPWHFFWHWVSVDHDSCMQKLESFFWPPQRHISASRSEKNLHETDLSQLDLWSSR